MTDKILLQSLTGALVRGNPRSIDPKAFDIWSKVAEDSVGKNVPLLVQGRYFADEKKDQVFNIISGSLENHPYETGFGHTSIKSSAIAKPYLEKERFYNHLCLDKTFEGAHLSNDHWQVAKLNFDFAKKYNKLIFTGERNSGYPEFVTTSVKGEIEQLEKPLSKFMSVIKTSNLHNKSKTSLEFKGFYRAGSLMFAKLDKTEQFELQTKTLSNFILRMCLEPHEVKFLKTVKAHSGTIMLGAVALTSGIALWKVLQPKPQPSIA